MSKEYYKVGTILENSLRQFAKVISIKNGVYGISGWSSRESAEKATVAYKHINSYGLKYANVKVVVSASAKLVPTKKASSSTATKEAKSKAKGKTKAKGGKTTSKAKGKTKASK